ncbi:hypothetical protein PVAP13_9KG053700 [Panicum virgatum]|uniref:Uncharacterized protein n=1 Tax=Panicum virgatum TaxID=38727 RepID=A0A8T0NEB8_PANVG|nr:hypothetical protein PVAP13_9KG053700 [Panicum virgatum]
MAPARSGGTPSWLAGIVQRGLRRKGAATASPPQRSWRGFSDWGLTPAPHSTTAAPGSSPTSVASSGESEGGGIEDTLFCAAPSASGRSWRHDALTSGLALYGC